jgi:hypothetical protein
MRLQESSLRDLAGLLQLAMPPLSRCQGITLVAHSVDRRS